MRVRIGCVRGAIYVCGSVCVWVCAEEKERARESEREREVLCVYVETYAHYECVTTLALSSPIYIYACGHRYLLKYVYMNMYVYL